MVQNELVLLTIRHYHNHIAAELLGNKQPLLQQLTPQTAQYLVHK
jgi:flagellar biosynthesis/type III secretory pathway chaperone